MTEKPNAPYGLWVHGNDNTAGAVRAVDAIAAGLNWRQVHAAVEVTAADKDARDACFDLGGTVAASLMTQS